MNIRTELTLTFFTIVIVVLSIITVSIYFLSSNYREEDFYRRLKNRAINTAKILMNVEEVNAELLKRLERNNPASLPNQYIAIYNYKNEELYSSEEQKVIKVDTDLLQKIKRDGEIQFRYFNFEAVGFSMVGEKGRHIIVAAATDVYGRNALQNLGYILIIIFCMSTVLVSILGWFYAGRVVNPISKIIRRVSSITEANLTERLDEGNKRDELSKLAQTFNKMLERLQGAFSSQKNFIANASHELKTPITLMSSEIDVTLLQDRDKEHYIKVLRSVFVSLKGLNKLTTQLLLLAQTSVAHPEKNFSFIRIDDILWDVKAELLKAYPHYSIDIVFDLNLNPDWLLIEGDEQLIKVAIINLMDNGCKYADDNRVSITLNSKDPQSIAIEFANKGEVIESDDAEKIFAPFFRGKNKKVEGFGIGLSLVKGIIMLHSGEIRIESRPFNHTHFIVTFPLKQHNTKVR